MIELLWLQICLILCRLNDYYINAATIVTASYMLDGNIDIYMFNMLVAWWLTIVVREVYV
jgi:hypothetical protein